MCGILGQVKEGYDQEIFKKALNKLNYRGPDNSGVFSYNNVILGHNRLAILDLDSRSNQPFHSSDKAITITFNGEIYNYKEIRSQLVSMGHKFTTESDTEVIIESYRAWGIECIKRFHGMFAFCILDRPNQKLVLTRDRFGEKPLFYFFDPAVGFFFGSEIKALISLVQFQPPLDVTSIIDFLHFGYIPAPKTIYKQMFKLLPGHYLEYSLARNSLGLPSPYNKITFSSQNSSLSEKGDLFNSIALKVAAEVSISDVSLGAFLSGGVDSSGSVAYLKQVHQDINTFTAGFNSSEFDESNYATLVATHLGVKNTNRKIDYGDFLESYSKMIDMYDEPHNDFSFVPTYLICKEAAKFHTVMISGDGADEIFCGYPRYHKLQLFQKFKNFRTLNTMVAKGASFLPSSSNLRRQAAVLSRSNGDFFFYVMSLNFSPDEAPLIYGPDLKHLAQTYSSREIIDHYLKEVNTDSLIQKQRYLDIKMTLGDDMLVKVDRASMANSIEVRPFYLHPLITDFAFNLRPEELVTSKTDKYFLKKTLEPSLPHSILYRNKMGFTFPLKELILGKLRPFFDDCISHLPDSLINKKRINEILELHSKGKRNYVPQLHSLMYLGYWLKQNKISI